MKRIILLSILGLLAMQVEAQSYITAIGGRIGPDWGLTIQQRLAKSLTIEGIAESSSSRDEVMLTGLLEKHIPLITRHFNIYGGAGIHKGWSTNQREFVEDPYGLTLIGGAELTLGRINLSYDFKPALNIVGGERKFFTSQAFSLRIVLFKDTIFYQGKKKNRCCNNRRDGW